MKEREDICGVTLSYSTEGSGPQPVIVMHGWGCSADIMAIPATAALCAATTVYNLDLPGFGDSSEPATAWTLDRYMEMLRTFVERHCPSAPILIGHSFGGRIAIKYAAAYPTRALILIDAAGIKPRHGLKYYVKVYSFKAAKRILPYLVGRRRADIIVERWRGRAGSSDYRQATAVMRATMSLAIGEDLTPLLPSIPCPTLLIWGEADTATPMRDARLMEARIPDAGLVSYPGAGHFSFAERPAQVSAVIQSFIHSITK